MVQSNLSFRRSELTTLLWVYLKPNRITVWQSFTIGVIDYWSSYEEHSGGICEHKRMKTMLKHWFGANKTPPFWHVRSQNRGSGMICGISTEYIKSILNFWSTGCLPLLLVVRWHGKVFPGFSSFRSNSSVVATEQTVNVHETISENFRWVARERLYVFHYMLEACLSCKWLPCRAILFLVLIFWKSSEGIFCW